MHSFCIANKASIGIGSLSFEASSSGINVAAKTFWHTNPFSLIVRLMIDLMLEKIRLTDAELRPF
jgi:hypothetical protein